MCRNSLREEEKSDLGMLATSPPSNRDFSLTKQPDVKAAAEAACTDREGAGPLDAEEVDREPEPKRHRI